MNRNVSEANMHRVDKISLEPDDEDLSVAAAGEVLLAAGFDQKEISLDEVNSHIKHWDISDRWIVSRDSSTHHGESRTKRLEGVSQYPLTAVAYVKTRSWHNEMMESVECPECGLESVRLALPGHKNSSRCRAQQNMNEVRERDLSPINTHSKPLYDLIAEHSEVGIEHLGTGYDPGGPNRRSVVRTKGYATENGIRKAKEKYLPAAVSRAGGRYCERVRIVWRDEDHCIATSGNTMYVVDIEHSDRIYRRRSLYLSSYSGSTILYNSDGWRVGVPISEYAGKITDQRWHSDRAVLVVTTDDGGEQTVELPHPIDTVTREPCYPDTYNSFEEATEDGAEINFVPKPTSAAFIPGQVVAAENGVLVNL